MSNKKEVCPRCKGTGEVFSGYYGHPETSSGGPMMYWCSLCDGDRVVDETIALKEVCKRIPDFC